MTDRQAPGSDEATLDAANATTVATTTTALEYVERSRGHFCAFHQLIGWADFLFEENARRRAGVGQNEEAAPLSASVVGRDVLEGRWTYAIVERFDNEGRDRRVVSAELRQVQAERVAPTG